MATVTDIRPVLGFNPFTDPQLETLGNAIDTGLYADTVDYPNPPVDHPTFKGQLSAFSAAVLAAIDGSKKAIAEKKKQRTAFCKMLRPLGHYVEANCKNDMTIFLKSGYQPIARVRTQQAVTVPTIVNVTNGNTGQLITRAKTKRNVASLDLRYGVSVANAVPASWTTVSFTNARSMALNGLTPGMTYVIQVRALGSLGNSDWSDPVSRVCI